MRRYLARRSTLHDALRDRSSLLNRESVASSRPLSVAAAALVGPIASRSFIIDISISGAASRGGALKGSNEPGCKCTRRAPDAARSLLTGERQIAMQLL